LEVYLSLYAGPITGLASHDNIEGYTQNATNSAGLGLSAPTPYLAKHLTFSLGVSNAARMFTTDSRVVVTSDRRPVFTTHSRVEFTTGRAGNELPG
jgi:hypothetical protein